MFKVLQNKIKTNMKNLLELVMIVKNSGDVLRECLKENKKWIDSWTILDTGSTDNTIDIIKEELKDIDGNLYFSDFIDFSYARNKCLELSSKKCKYQIMLDDSYILQGGKELRKILEKNDTACFLIKIAHYNNGYLSNEYTSKRILKTSENLRYKYRLHEEIIIDEDKTQVIKDNDIFLNDIIVKEHTDRTYTRKKRDLEALLLDYKDDPNDTRTIYFLATVYSNLDDYKNSLKYYDILKNFDNKKHNKEMWENYYLFSALYETANINYFLSDNNDHDNYEKELISIQKRIKNRIEPSYRLALLYKNLGKVNKTEKIVENLLYHPKPDYVHTLLDSDIYDFNIEYLYIETKLMLGKVDEAIIVVKNLLKRYPDNQELLNIKYNLCYRSDGTNSLDISSIKLTNNKTIVIHLGHNISCFNPKENDPRISGSEFMALNLAKEFVKLDYRVIVFGSFEDKISKLNYESTYEDIEYIDYKYFNEFVLKYVIDYLIVSRQTCNLVYYNNIKNVYLWVHDVLPVNTNSKGFQIHKNKFKGIIAISNWQKNNIIKKLNLPEDLFIVSRNAIYIERFLNKNIKKIPYRFIYSSMPDRGLSNLIKIMPLIKQKYPQTTLYIFANKNNIDTELLKIIESSEYIFLSPRLKQNELAIEFLKSDIWLYPTSFQETYCITSLEAMAAKCLVATVNYCGLGEIVYNKGVVCNSPIEDNLENLVEKLFFVLERPKLKEFFIEKAYNWAIEQTYQNLSQEWSENILK
jgi:glycosyltransferase involved in cell wall biosynthesis